MLKFERQNKILELLNENDSLLVTEMSKIFKCSDETIRRDLKELDKAKLLTRTHGGAFMARKNDKTYPTKIRNILLLNEKTRLSEKVINFINENDLIFLDSSTTCYQLAKHIISNKMNVTIATNSILIANLCTETKNNIELIMLGGHLRNNNMSTVGMEGLEQIKNYYADKCIISPPKLNIELGIFDNNNYEASIRKAMIDNSSYKILMVDHTKLSDFTNYKICDTDFVDLLITNKSLDEKNKIILDEKNIEYVKA